MFAAKIVNDLNELTIITAIAVPAYQQYSIRTSVSEAFSVMNSTKAYLTVVCHENRGLTGITNTSIGYLFTPGTDTAAGGEDYIESLIISGSCAAPTITLTTSAATGAPVPPVITLQGNVTTGSTSWACSIQTAADINHVPAICR